MGNRSSKKSKSSDKSSETTEKMADRAEDTKVEEVTAEVSAVTVEVEPTALCKLPDASAAATEIPTKLASDEKADEEEEKAEPPRAPINPALLAGVKGFDKSAVLKPTETVVRHIAYIAAAKPGGAGPDSAISEEEIKEFYDTPEELNEKVKEFVKYLKESKHTVFHTGAGVSTAAKLPDYRGPTGVWTLRSKGYEPSFQISCEQAVPTYTHMAIVALLEHGILNYLVSTNVDGLHRRSGVRADQMAELHGNIYREYCEECGTEYLRPFDVTKLRKGRRTGRLCEKPDCKGKLRDSIINFGENLPEEELESASEHSKRADFNVVLGSSMRVSPACNLPELSYKRMDPSMPGRGRLAIVNLQKTLYDPYCWDYEPEERPKGVRVFAKIDDFMQLVMKELEIEVAPFGEDLFKQDCESMAKSIIKDPEFWKLPSD